MNTCQLLIKSSFTLGALLSLATFANPVMAAPVDVATLATASNAAVGESGTSIGASALIEVLVTDSTGNPVNNLGS